MSTQPKEPKEPKLTAKQLARRIMKQTPLPPMLELKKDLRQAARTLSPKEVRYLVSAYYDIQKYRTSPGNQIIALTKAGEPCTLLAWIALNMEQLENEIKKWLDIYTSSEPTGIGAWCKSIVGIGPVISAGLLTHIDMNKAPTAGHIWRFAGYEPSLKWLGAEGARKLLVSIDNIPETFAPDDEEEVDRYAMNERQVADLAELLGKDNTKVLNDRQLVAIAQLSGRTFPSILRGATDDKGNITKASMLKYLSKRPWNSGLKRICFLMGECFIRTRFLKKSFYGPLYWQRKLLEIERNDAGQYADQAAEILRSKHFSKGTPAYAAYSAGRLPDGHINARARHWTVKLFLSHYHEVAYLLTFGKKPPKPFMIEHRGHTHYIPPPETGEAWEEDESMTNERATDDE